VPCVKGDKVQISQVLLNLAINGMDSVADLDATRRHVRLATRLAEPGWVEFSVTDAGHGIPDDVMKKIFEPFYTTKPNGMGMGLSVSRTIVEAHGGKLWAENAPNHGAVFKVLLPVFGDGSEPG
jgi:signal transduction histidine kinase